MSWELLTEVLGYDEYPYIVYYLRPWNLPTMILVFASTPALTNLVIVHYWTGRTQVGLLVEEPETQSFRCTLIISVIKAAVAIVWCLNRMMTRMQRKIPNLNQPASLTTNVNRQTWKSQPHGLRKITLWKRPELPFRMVMLWLHMIHMGLDTKPQRYNFDENSVEKRLKTLSFRSLISSLYRSRICCYHYQ
jgi:hypothetical protein